MATGGAAATGFVLNIGGEGEVPGAINFQGAWVFYRNYASAAEGQTLAQMQSAGNVFVVGSNSALPFGRVFHTVITNSTPIGEAQFNFLGPLVQPSQIWQVLTPTGEWINNGVIQPRP